MALAETANLFVKLNLKDGLSTGIGRATKNLGRFDKGVGRTGKGVGQMGLGFARAGAILATAAVGGIAAATKAAIDYEDAFAGVRKTVEATEPELQALSLEFRKMATEIPIAATEFARIGELGGALGVPTENLAEFTRTVALLGVTTDVSTEDAATALGQLTNVIGLTGDEYDNFASTLVGLGNIGASTESQILEIARRSGSAAALIGIAKDETVGWAAAAANLGMQQELAGTALQSFYLKALTAVKGGGSDLRMLADAANMSKKEFAELFSKDSSAALERFIAGLSKMDEGDQLSVVQEVFGKTSGLTRLILGLASSYDKNLNPSIDASTSLWAENTAMQEEARKRFETVRSSIALLKNNLVEAAMVLGEGVAPAIGRAATKLAEFLKQGENRAALKKLGTDIGKAIDGVPWDRVLGFARSLVGAFEPALATVKAIAGFVSMLPPELLGAGAGIVVTNKLSGGLLGEGLGNIFGGLGESLSRSVLAGLTGGKLGGLPVWVLNMPGGGMPGGGGGGIPPAVAGAAAGIGAPGAATLAAGIGIALAPAISAYLTRGAPTQPIAVRDNMGTLAPKMVQMFQGLMPQFTTLAANAGSVSLAPKLATLDMDADKANAVAMRQNMILSQINTEEKRAVLHVDSLKNRLSSLQQRLHNAKEAGDRSRQAALRGKIEAVKGRIAASNAKLEAIRRKKTSFVSKVNVRTQTSFSIRGLGLTKAVQDYYVRKSFGSI